MGTLDRSRAHSRRLKVLAIKTLSYPNPRHLNQLYAGQEENLVHAEKVLGVSLVSREAWLKVEGCRESVGVSEQRPAFAAGEGG